MIEANDLFERVYFMKLNGGSEIGQVIPANYEIRKKFFYSTLSQVNTL